LKEVRVFERNEQEISQILEENLEEVLSGKTSMEDVLRRYPQHAVGLRREFEAVLWLTSRSEQLKPRPGFISASRKRVVERVKEEARSQGKKRAVLSFGWPQQRRVFQWAAGLVVVFVLLLSGVGGLVSFSQDTLPGQQLYGVKRMSESVALGLAVDKINKVELSIQITDRRLQEVEALLKSGDSANIQATLAEFASGVEQSVALLQQVDDEMPAEKLVLAQRLTSELNKQAYQLAILAATAPENLQASLMDAQSLTQNGASSAMVVLNEMNEILGTSTPTGSPTEEILLPDTATIIPSKTPRPTLEKTAAKLGLTKTPEDVQKKATITPRPTNPNRPTDSGKNPTKEPKPPKEDKPTNDNRPTRTDKKNK
jgi:hypothetical protein